MKIKALTENKQQMKTNIKNMTSLHKIQIQKKTLEIRKLKEDAQKKVQKLQIDMDRNKASTEQLKNDLICHVEVEKSCYGECLICLQVKYINVVFMPCKHNGCCIECANQIHASQGTCPICRVELSGGPIEVFNQIKNDQCVVNKL